MSERRESKRRYLKDYLQIVNRKNDEIIGYLVNITKDGLMIISENPLATNRMYQLRVITPQGFKETKYIDLDIRCIWCEKDKIKPHLYAAGFSICNLNETNVELIQHLINQYGLRLIDDTNI